jgi:hypothetical protein
VGHQHNFFANYRVFTSYRIVVYVTGPLVLVEQRVSQKKIRVHLKLGNYFSLKPGISLRVWGHAVAPSRFSVFEMVFPAFWE